MKQILMGALCLSLLTGWAPARAHEPADLNARASAAYQSGDFAAAGVLYMEIVENGWGETGDAFNAGCSFALAGDPDAAFGALDVAIELGFGKAEQLSGDTDLESLRADPRWEGLLERCVGNAKRQLQFWDNPVWHTEYREDITIAEKVAGLSRLWSGAKYGFVNFDLVPDLEPMSGLAAGEASLLDLVAGDLIDWLFPDPAVAVMPIISVTGTNGKTTTCRMISRILQHAGRRTGLVCSDGIYLDGKLVSKGDACTFIGHSRALTSKLVDTAVLESHHRGIAVRGFAFHSCDVAVCLNVTPEHLRDGEIETVEQMAEIKRALVERAGTGTVLFADDSHCMAMLDYVEADTTCLVSLRAGVEELRKLVSHPVTCFCVLEWVDGREWIVLYDNHCRLPILEVNEIPATFDGTARFNVSNAMHSIAAVYLDRITIEDIRVAMSQFTTAFDSTPGRLNVYDALPFRVILDHAHNADGFRKLSEFIDFQPVSGRKILVFGIASTFQDEAIVAAMSELAGHFDHYVCVN